MPDRRFEDKVSIDDVLKDNPNNKILLAKIYLQCRETNGTVGRHDKCIENLKTDIKDKIGLKELSRVQKIFAWITGLIAFVLIAFNIFDRVMIYMGG